MCKLHRFTYIKHSNNGRTRAFYLIFHVVNVLKFSIFRLFVNFSLLLFLRLTSNERKKKPFSPWLPSETLPNPTESRGNSSTMIPEWKMMIIVGFLVNDKVLGSLFFLVLKGKLCVRFFFTPIWKWAVASEAFYVFSILSHEFFNGFLMSKEGKQDTHKLNDFSSRSFSSPPSSCLSGLILKIWLSIPKVLCCVFHSVGCGASETQMMWGVNGRGFEEWNLMKHDYGFSATEARESERWEETETNSWWIIYDDLLSIVVARGTWNFFALSWVMNSFSRCTTPRSCKEHGGRHNIFVISIPFFLFFDDKKLIEFFSSSESFLRCEIRWLNWKENEPAWVMENRSGEGLILFEVYVNQSKRVFEVKFRLIVVGKLWKRIWAFKLLNFSHVF